MNEQEQQQRQPLTARQDATLRFIRQFGRKETAWPVLRVVAHGIGAKKPQNAKEFVDALVRKQYLARHPERGKLYVTDEPSIPVILASGRVAPREPLLEDRHVVETVRGVLVEGFDPPPDFFIAVVETRAAKLVAVRKETDATDGTAIVGRLRNQIVFGTVEKGQVTVQVPGEAGSRQIKSNDPKFRLEGRIVGEITARALDAPDGARVSCERGEAEEIHHGNPSLIPKQDAGRCRETGGRRR